ncbi:MAG TPA: outer membrane beta-barrel protein [Smithella sp.]|nr:outer membrane beta-barrel protein [Smithella sp.]
MKKILSVIVGFMMLMMIPGISIGSDASPAKKAKAAKFKAAAVNKPYVSVQGGVAFLTDSDVDAGIRSTAMDFDPGYALGVAAGYKMGKYRVEGEIGYQKNEVDKALSGRRTSGDMKAYSFLVNGYYDIATKTRFTPYLTAGIGVAKVDGDFNRIAHVDDTAFAYQVGAGVAYAVNRALAVDLKYRYMDTVDDFGFGNTNPEFSTHNVFLGLRYCF